MLLCNATAESKYFSLGGQEAIAWFPGTSLQKRYSVVEIGFYETPGE